MKKRFFSLLFALLLLLSGCCRTESPETSSEPTGTILDLIPEPKYLYPVRYAKEVLAAAESYELDPALLFAVIRTESSFRPDAVSPAGAVGLMQLTEETFNDICEWRGLSHEFSELTDPALNIDFGAYYLRRMIRYYEGSVECALLAYNAGPGNLNGWQKNEGIGHGEVPASIPFGETAAYLPKVLSAMEQYKTIYQGDYAND